MRSMGRFILIVSIFAFSVGPIGVVLAQTNLPAVQIMRAELATGTPHVTVDLSIIDQTPEASGRFIGGLSSTDFQVFEDNQPVPPGDVSVTEEPVGLALVAVVDTGKWIATQRGVTGATRWGDLRDQSDDRSKNGLVNELVKYRLDQPEDWIGFVGVGKEVSPTASLKRDQNSVINALVEMQPYNNVTPLRAGIDQALKMFDVPEVSKNVRRAIVIFSDGIDVTKSPDEFVDLIQRANRQNIAFYTVAMASPNSAANYDTTGLERLAKQTNGAFVLHNNLEQRAAVLTMFDRIVTQRSQYRLRYPTHLGQGQHAVRVVVNTPAGTVEAQADFVSIIQMPVLEIKADKDALEKGGQVTITPDWHAVDSFDRPPARIEYLVDSKIISTVMILDPFVWSTTDEPNVEHEYAIEARGYDSILSSAQPVVSNQVKVRMTVPTQTKVVQSVSNNWLGLLMLPVVIVLLIIVIPNRKKIAQTARATTQRLNPTRRLAPPGSSAARYKLIMLGHGQEFLLTEKVMRIGRDPSSGVLLNDPGVSMAHAELAENQQNGYMIYDLNSTNGTYVNSHRLQAGAVPGQPGQPVMLNPGDTIRVGGVELQFNYAKATRRLPTN